VETVDCGDTAANWLSKYLLDKDCGVRLGYYLADVMPRRVAAEKLKQCYKTFKNRDLVIVNSFVQHMQFFIYAGEKSHLRLQYYYRNMYKNIILKIILFILRTNLL
jgi:hypothetical protein